MNCRFLVLFTLLWATAHGSAFASEADEKSEQPGTAAAWVTFHAPAFTGDRLSHGGPDWRFETPRLPALSSDARSILVADSEIRLGGPPNLVLRVLRVSDHAVLSTMLILSANEFVDAAAPAMDGVTARAFADLAKRVHERLGMVAPTLAKAKWTPLSACSITPGADDSQPPCSVKVQEIACADMHLRYTRGGLRGHFHGQAFQSRAKILSPAPVKQESFGTITVRACLAGAWFDPDSSVFAGMLRNECQAGGDWCIAQPGWYVEKLGGGRKSSRATQRAERQGVLR